MQVLQILIMRWWLVLIFFLNPAPCFCYFHSSVIGRLYNVLFGFNEKSNAQLLFLESIERGYPQGDEDGLQEALSTVRDKLGRQGCWAPWMEERRLLRRGFAGSCSRCFQRAPCGHRRWALNTVHVLGIRI